MQTAPAPVQTALPPLLDRARGLVTELRAALDAAGASVEEAAALLARSPAPVDALSALDASAAELKEVSTVLRVLGDLGGKARGIRDRARAALAAKRLVGTPELLAMIAARLDIQKDRRRLCVASWQTYRSTYHVFVRDVSFYGNTGHLRGFLAGFSHNRLGTNGLDGIHLRHTLPPFLGAFSNLRSLDCVLQDLEELELQIDAFGEIGFERRPRKFSTSFPSLCRLKYIGFDAVDLFDAIGDRSPLLKDVDLEFNLIEGYCVPPRLAFWVSRLTCYDWEDLQVSAVDNPDLRPNTVKLLCETFEPGPLLACWTDMIRLSFLEELEADYVSTSALAMGLPRRLRRLRVGCFDLDHDPAENKRVSAVLARLGGGLKADEVRYHDGPHLDLGSVLARP